jgi:hypothetical protein
VELTSRPGADKGPHRRPPPAEWLTIRPTKFVLEPYATKEIEYAVTTPPGYPGELDAIVFFDFGRDGQVGQGKTGVSLFAAIEGSIDPECRIADIRIKRDRNYIFIVKVENTYSDNG